MDEQHDDLSAFRKFIEDELAFDKPRTDAASAVSPYTDLPSDDAPYPSLHRDIAEIWALLQKEAIGKHYYANMLTSLEQATRAELERLILKRLRPTLPDELTNRQLRSIIAYSMTMGWLVLSAVQEKSQDDGGPDLGNDIDLSDLDF